MRNKNIYFIREILSFSIMATIRAAACLAKFDKTEREGRILCPNTRIKQTDYIFHVTARAAAGRRIRIYLEIFNISLNYI